jgi:hypothetical protein
MHNPWTAQSRIVVVVETSDEVWLDHIPYMEFVGTVVGDRKCPVSCGSALQQHGKRKACAFAMPGCISLLVGVSITPDFCAECRSRYRWRYNQGVYGTWRIGTSVPSAESKTVCPLLDNGHTSNSHGRFDKPRKEWYNPIKN